MGLRETQKKQRYEKLLDSFGRMLRKKSFDDITMQQLAAASRVSVGTIYNYFEDKDALVMAFVREGLKPYFDKAERIAAVPPADARAALSALLGFYLEAFISLPKALVTRAIQISMSNELSAMPSSGFHNHIIEHILELVENLKKMGSIRTSLNTEAAALVLFGMVADLVYQYSMRPDLDLKELTRRLGSCLEVILDGLDSRTGATSPSGALR